MIKKIYKFSCADCPTVGEYASKDEAKSFGWAVARGEKECYCPACAFRHRNTGCGGAKSNRALKGQICINDIEVQDGA